MKSGEGTSCIRGLSDAILPDVTSHICTTLPSSLPTTTTISSFMHFVEKERWEIFWCVEKDGGGMFWFVVVLCGSWCDIWSIKSKF